MSDGESKSKKRTTAAPTVTQTRAIERAQLVSNLSAKANRVVGILEDGDWVHLLVGHTQESKRQTDKGKICYIKCAGIDGVAVMVRCGSTNLVPIEAARIAQDSCRGQAMPIFQPMDLNEPDRLSNAVKTGSPPPKIAIHPDPEYRKEPTTQAQDLMTRALKDI